MFRVGAGIATPWSYWVLIEGTAVTNTPRIPLFLTHVKRLQLYNPCQGFEVMRSSVSDPLSNLTSF